MTKNTDKQKMKNWLKRQNVVFKELPSDNIIVFEINEVQVWTQYSGLDNDSVMKVSVNYTSGWVNSHNNSVSYIKRSFQKINWN